MNLPHPAQHRNARTSNFELLRLVTMLFVLVTHICFFAQGLPDRAALTAAPANALFRLFVQCLVLCCVSVFVFISGWFGIHPKKERLAEFLFQCLFFSVGLFIATALIKRTPLTLQGIAHAFLFPNYWFVIAYLILYFLAPVLNAFAEHADKKEFAGVLIAFFSGEFIYGFLFDTNGFSSGASTIHFIGLYLLARYVRKYPMKVTSFKAKTDFYIYLILSILNVFFGAFLIEKGGWTGRFMGHTNPFTLLSALYLVLCFSKLTFRSRCINFLAPSAFAVYLFHCHERVLPSFTSSAHTIYESNYGLVYLGKIIVFILLVYLVSILLDLIRRCIWAVLSRKRHGPVIGTPVVKSE